MSTALAPLNHSFPTSESEADRPPAFSANHRLLFVACGAMLGEAAVRELADRTVRTPPERLDEYPSAEEFQAYLPRERSDWIGVFIGMRDPERGAKLLKAAAEARPEAALIAVGVEDSAELVLAAMRAGAREYMLPPFEQDRVVALLRSTQRRRSAASTGDLISFLPAHGGAGASAAALHVAGALARSASKSDPKNNKVLAADFDSHDDALAGWTGVRAEYTLLDALHRPEAVHSCWPQLTKPFRGFDVMAAPSWTDRLPQCADERVEEVLCAALHDYRYVVADLPPRDPAIARRVLEMSQRVFLVCTPEVRSLRLARRSLDLLRRIGVADEAIRLVLNRVSGRHALSQANAAQALGRSIDAAIGNDYDALAEAFDARRLVPSGSRLGRDYARLAASIAGADAKEPAKTGAGWSFGSFFGAWSLARATEKA